MLQTLYGAFWWERLWLPANLSWADLQDRDGCVYAKAADLYVTLPLALLFLVVRQLFETYVATPLAGLLNVKEKIRLKAAPNATLEKFYATTKHPKQADVETLSRQSGCTVRQVERWFRRRRNQDRPSLLKKFREASWRFTFYLLAFIAGMAVIVDKPWFYDLREVWKGYPVQSMLPSQYWYYMIELSFYWSLLFSVASDVKRKDFKEQIIHHVATIILISFSWFTNYIRVGTLIMALHDSSDYLLEVARPPAPASLSPVPPRHPLCVPSVRQDVQLRRLEKHLQQHLHRLRRRLHHHPPGHPALLDHALHAGLPAGALPRVLRLLLLQLHDGGAAGAARVLGLPHHPHGPQVHNWKGGGRREERPRGDGQLGGGGGGDEERAPVQRAPRPQQQPPQNRLRCRPPCHRVLSPLPLSRSLLGCFPAFSPSALRHRGAGGARTGPAVPSVPGVPRTGTAPPHGPPGIGSSPFIPLFPTSASTSKMGKKTGKKSPFPPGVRIPA